MTDTMETPETSTTADVWSISLPAKVLGRVLGNAALFVSTDRKYPRPILQGVNVRFAIGPARMIVEATDSYVLWQDTLPLAKATSDVPTPTRAFILPAADLTPIVKALAKTKGSYTYPTECLVTFHHPYRNTADTEKVGFLIAGNTLVIDSTDGDFPSIDAAPDADPPRASIWPSIKHKGLDPASISLNPVYLARFGKLTRRNGAQVGKERDGVRLTFHGATRAIGIEDTNAHETWRGLLMPTRES